MAARCHVCHSPKWLLHWSKSKADSIRINNLLSYSRFFILIRICRSHGYTFTSGGYTTSWCPVRYRHDPSCINIHTDCYWQGRFLHLWTCEYSAFIIITCLPFLDFPSFSSIPFIFISPSRVVSILDDRMKENNPKTLKRCLNCWCMIMGPMKEDWWLLILLLDRYMYNIKSRLFFQNIRSS